MLGIDVVVVDVVPLKMLGIDVVVVDVVPLEMLGIDNEGVFCFTRCMGNDFEIRMERYGP